MLDDEAAAIAWADKFRPECVRRSIDSAAVKRHHTVTGQVPPGYHIETTEARENFYIGPVSMPAAELPGRPRCSRA